MRPEELSDHSLAKTPAIHNPLHPDNVAKITDPNAPTKPCADEDSTCAVPPLEPARPGDTVDRDGSGKTTEGNTGVSGETDASAPDRD